MSERSIISIVREYANAQGCVVLKGNKFVSRDGERSVRFSEVINGSVIVWDTGTPLGYVSLPRGERRIIGISTQKEHGDEGALARNEGRERNQKPLWAN